MPREPDTTRPETILPLCPNMPATLLEKAQTTLSQGECMNPGGGFDQGAGREQTKHFALSWLPLDPCCTAAATAMKDVTRKHFLLLLIPSQCRGCELQSALPCNTLSSNHGSSHTRKLRSHNWKEAIPRYCAETGNKRKPRRVVC